MADKSTAAEALREQALYLFSEKKKNRLAFFDAAFRDAQFEQGIAGCIAGARALGFEIDLPEESLPPLDAQRMFSNARQSIMYTRSLYQKAWAAEPPVEQSTATNEVNVPAPPTMPKIAKVVLSYLKSVGSRGTKAAEIRAYIDTTYHQDIHEKTVGMTLYRLQKAGSVRRDGHHWFLASQEAANPGGDTPGPINART